MWKREEKFKPGQILRVKDAKGFIRQKQFENRDVVLLENILDMPRQGYEKEFHGRVHVEFQKRNGRGKVFREVMNQNDFEAYDPSTNAP